MNSRKSSIYNSLSFYKKPFKTAYNSLSFYKKPFKTAYRFFYINLLYQLLCKCNVGFSIHLFFLPKKDRKDLFYNLLNINLTEIKWGGRPPDKSREGNYIIDGNWDMISKMPIDDYISTYSNCCSVKEIFQEGIPYWKTEQYREMLQSIAAGDKDSWIVRGCQTKQDVEEYFERLKNIYVNMKNKGYKCQKSLGKKEGHDEIEVYIDRYGELHKQNGYGHHRLAMASILDIDKVPVVIRGIHRLWAQKCFLDSKFDFISAINEGISSLGCGNER